MIPHTSVHPQTRRDVYDPIGFRQTGNPKERVTEPHGSDSLAAEVVSEFDQFPATSEFRQTLWYQAFYHQVLAGVSVLYPHMNAPAKAKMAQEYTDDLVYGGYLRALQSLTVPGGCKHASFAEEFAKSHGIAVRTHQREMDRLYAACRDLLAVILPWCWNLAKWCLYHGLRLTWRILTGLCRIIVSRIKDHWLIPEDQASSTQNHAASRRTTRRRWRQHRRENRLLAVRRFQSR